MTSTFSDSFPSVVVPSRLVRPQGPQSRPVYDTQARVPGWQQDQISRAEVVAYGCGGIGSWLVLGALKYGVGGIHCVDADPVEISNLNRQFHLPEHIGIPKGIAIAHTLAPHGILGTKLYGHGLFASEFIKANPTLRPATGLEGTDNDKARKTISQHHLAIGRPLLSIALREDAGGGQVFVQEPGKACLGCYLGNVLGSRRGSCPGAPAVLDCAQTVAGYALYALSTLLCRRPRTWNLLQVDLASGSTRAFQVPRRSSCPMCGALPR